MGSAREQLRVATKRMCAVLIAATAAAGCGGGGSITDPPAGPFTVGGTVSGLIGSGCVVQNNGGDDITLVSANNTFTFPTLLATGAAYSATVFRPPSGPNQTCTISNGSGTVSGANVTNVAVNCSVDRLPCSESQDLGEIGGDAGFDVVNTTGLGEFWVRLRLRELSGESMAVSAWVTLDMPSGVDYDLEVHCASCTAGTAARSAEGPGKTDEVKVYWDDRPGPDDSALILIHVIYASGSSPNTWTMRVIGNTGQVGATKCSIS